MPQPGGHQELPAWSLDRDQMRSEPEDSVWPLGDARDWAWGGATGAGVRVCDHGQRHRRQPPAGRPGAGAVTVTQNEGGELDVVPDSEGDAFGHGTACAAIVRKLAPELRDPLRPGARWRADRQRHRARARPALGDRAALRGHQPEPVDDQEPVRRGAARAGRSGLLSRLASSWPRRTTCRWSRFRGASPRCCRWAAMPAPIRSSTTSTPSLRSNSPRPGWTSSWPGRAARRSGPAATHSPRPTWPGSPRWCCPSTPGLRPFELKTALRAAGNNVRSAA